MASAVWHRTGPDILIHVDAPPMVASNLGRLSGNYSNRYKNKPVNKKLPS